MWSNKVNNSCQALVSIALSSVGVSRSKANFASTDSTIEELRLFPFALCCHVFPLSFVGVEQIKRLHKEKP